MPALIAALDAEVASRRCLRFRAGPSLRLTCTVWIYSNLDEAIGRVEGDEQSLAYLFGGDPLTISTPN